MKKKFVYIIQNKNNINKNEKNYLIIIISILEITFNFFSENWWY